MSVVAKPRLIVRTCTLRDLDAIAALSIRVYGPDWASSSDMVRGQLTNYPDGQFLAEYEGRVVGYCATFRIREAVAFAPHTWLEITGSGFAARHDPAGDYLYGMDVCVDREYRRMRIGQRLYDARKRLCLRERLKGIVFGGRLPGLARKIKSLGSAEAYVQAVHDRKLRDNVLNFQLRNGFEVLGLLPHYLESDRDSLGYAVHLVWRNPTLAREPVAAVIPAPERGREVVRVATVQYLQRKVSSFAEFSKIIEFFVTAMSGHRADFVVFPEWFTFQLLSIENAPLPAEQAMAKLAGYTEPLKQLLSGLALQNNINVVGGSHPTLDGDQLRNTSFVCLRDGSIHQQDKLHPTPYERDYLNIRGGARLAPIQTDCGLVGVLICYDSEFPELARHLADQGARLLFVPFCTDTREGYLRVRYCCQARAVENQLYVVTSGNVGNLPDVLHLDVQYAQSGIYTPLDFAFARDGIAAETTTNTESVAVADLRLVDLTVARNSGTVQNLKDRRFDLYGVTWRKKA
ncbi:MAG: GNAT family N-acetyltransferase [Azospirillum sp.]|nr:GNAT family N-acetyltransferase [Azospirillum sp.]